MLKAKLSLTQQARFSPAAGSIERPIGKRLDLLDKMVGWWNSAADNGWATLGHQTLGIDPEEGQLIGKVQCRPADKCN